MYRKTAFLYIVSRQCIKIGCFCAFNELDAQKYRRFIHCHMSMYKTTVFLCIFSPRCKKIGYFFTSKALNAQKALAGGRQIAHLVPLDQNKHRVFVVFLRFDADEVSAICRNETGQEGIPLFKRKRMFGVGELEIFHFARLLVVSNQIRFLFPDSCQI